MTSKENNEIMKNKWRYKETNPQREQDNIMSRKEKKYGEMKNKWRDKETN